MFYRLLTLLFILFSCSSNCESIIKIDELLLYYSEKDNFPYCLHVNNCLKKDENSVKIMFGQQRDFLDGETSYMDSFYIYQITKVLGEDNVVKLIKDFSKNELNVYYSKLEVGLEYESYKNNTVSESFPKIHTFIKIKGKGNEMHHRQTF